MSFQREKDPRRGGEERGDSICLMTVMMSLNLARV